MKRRLAVITILFSVAVEAQSPAPAPVTPESLVVAAKRAAGQDYAGTFLRICVAPDNAGGGAGAGDGRGRGAGNAAPAVPAVPDRATWYAQPYKVFDNLYFIGTKIHSSWALTTSQGIIVIDTLFDYAIGPEIVEGLTALGLNPRDVKFVLISHAHGDHDQGAALLQSRYGTKVVMGAADWDSTLQRPATAAGGVPKRDVAVGPENTKITLGDTTVDVIATPGHTPGTLSYIFPVKDRGRTLMVAYSGGTAFNFPRRAESFATYRDSQKKMADAARAAGATVLMTNHTEFDRAYDRARLAQLPRAAGEKHPYETDNATVLRYFEMAGDCAEAQRLSMTPAAQAAPALGAGAVAAAAPGEIVGVGNFAHIVADLDKSLGFYRDVLGLTVTGTIPYSPNDAVAKFGHTEGGQSRVAVLRVPGLAMGIELIEYKDIERKAQSPRFWDPGAANMSMRVRNLDALFPKIAAYPGVKVLTAGGKPATITLPNASMHAVFILDPDGFVVELADAPNAISDAGAGPVLGGGGFEATVRNSEETVKFYNQLLGFDFTLGAAFNDNQQMASTAGAPGASFRQSRTRIPGTSVPFTLIEFKNVERKELSGRTQDPGTTVVQLIVRDVTALTKKLKAAGVPIVTTGGEPVQVSPALKIAIVKDPNNMLLELVERR